MAITRTYIVPLRREFLKAPKHSRANKAVRALRAFLAKHMKSDNVLIGKNLNEKLWERGIKHPIHKVSVDVIKEDDGTVKAELTGFKWVEPIKPKKKEEKKGGIAGKLREMKEKASGSEKEQPESEEKQGKSASSGQAEKPKSEEKTPKAGIKKESSKPAEKKPEPKKEAPKPEPKKEAPKK